MGKTIGLISLKGGVGKTTISAALAVHLANEFGKKVLLVDTNYSAPNLGIHMNVISPKGSIHEVLDRHKMSSAINTQYGVDVVPGNFMYDKDVNPLKLRNKLMELKKHYDFIVLDSSPNVNEEMMSTIIASDNLFLVSTPDYPTLSCSMKAVKIARQADKRITGIILNKVKGKYEVDLEEMQEVTGVPVVAKIKHDEVNDLALYERIPAPLFAKRSAFTKEIDKLCMALTGEKERKSWLTGFIGKDYRKERVNRVVLREDFYRSMFR